MTALQFDGGLQPSSIRGRWQIPALSWITRVLLVAALIATVIPGPVGRALQVGVVGSAIAVPLLRVVWLIHRWRQERDWVFVRAGIALMVVIATGAVLAVMR